ncbi:site-specific DNA-methyltransferase [Hymenobacter ruber]
MVPEVQRRLIEVLCKVKPTTASLYDPFVGSGTALVAGMRNGLTCVGQDINPLAVLLANVKTQPFRYRRLQHQVVAVVKGARGDERLDVEVNFPGISKWFRSDVQRDLSRLRRAIVAQPAEARPFLWVILAETIRLTSNDRTSTYKLHARATEEANERKINAIDTFELLAKRGCEDLKDFHFTLAKARLLVKRATYKGQARAELANTQEKAVSLPDTTQKYDLLVTSPPYGDNTTTVPYGQHSYLALNWIELSDIAHNVDPTLLSTTQEIDRRSLGGALEHQKLAALTATLTSKSATLGATLQLMTGSKVYAPAARIASFYRDLDVCLGNILAQMNSNAYLCWTVASRRVSNIEIPIDIILKELMATRNVKYVTAIERTIHHKRMASRNNTADTMKKERILIFRTL